MTYHWYAGPEGGIVLEDGHPQREQLGPAWRHAGTFEAADHAAAHAELVRRLEALRQRIGERKGG